MSRTWRVVGGGEGGKGILVREGVDLKSAACASRLNTGSLLEEEALAQTKDNQRLNFTLLEGNGPAKGWVSLKLKEADLVAPCLQLPSGWIRGTAHFNREGKTAEESGKPIASFEGIPYAKPPVGELRFKKPVPVYPWKGEMDCTSRRTSRWSIAWQSGKLPEDEEDDKTKKREGGGGGLGKSKYQKDVDYTVCDEDCLHVTVYTPLDALISDASAEGRPVLVNIHGGGFVGGSMYDRTPSLYCRNHDIVLVSFNYRLSAFGLLCPDGGDYNCFLWDQILALQWVKRNISKFGGDPKKVTIMGQSAGADSVVYLLCAEPAKGLFQRAILGSFGSLLALTKDQNKELTVEMANTVWAENATLKAMQKLEAKDIAIWTCFGAFAISHTCGPGWRCRTQFWKGFPGKENLGNSQVKGMYKNSKKVTEDLEIAWTFPVATVDGVLLKEQPLDAILHGAAKDYEVIVGAGKEELFWAEDSLGGSWHEGGGREETVWRVAWELAGLGSLAGQPPEVLKEHAEDLVKCAEQDTEECTYYTDDDPEKKEQWLLDSVFTKCFFHAQTKLLVDRLAHPGNCKKVFRFEWEGWDYRPRGAGHHGTDYMLFWGDSLELPDWAEFESLREFWQSSFGAFMRTGNPNIKEMGDAWKPCRPGGKHNTLLWYGCLQEETPRGFAGEWKMKDGNTATFSEDLSTIAFKEGELKELKVSVEGKEFKATIDGNETVGWLEGRRIYLSYGDEWERFFDVKDGKFWSFDTKEQISGAELTCKMAGLYEKLCSMALIPGSAASKAKAAAPAAASSAAAAPKAKAATPAAGAKAATPVPGAKAATPVPGAKAATPVPGAKAATPAPGASGYPAAKGKAATPVVPKAKA